MTNGGDAAEQVVRLSLEGFEVAAKLFREILAFLITLLYPFLERIRHGCFRITHKVICAFIAEIMCLPFCEEDISMQPKEGHYRVDIAPELFLKRDG